VVHASGRFMGSRVARRLLLLFVVCALLPLGTFSFVAFSQVSFQLHEQSERRLHQASKAAGMTVIGRLASLELELRAIEEFLDPGGEVEQRPAIERIRPQLAELFGSVAVAAPGLPVRPLFGPTPEWSPGELSLPQREHLARGETLVVTAAQPDRSLAVFMLRQLEGGLASRLLLVAEIERRVLRDVIAESALPPLAEFCLLAGSGETIVCSRPEIDSFPESALSEMSSQTSGGFDWEVAGESHLAHYWSIFLEGRFGAGSWGLVLGEPRDMVLAPISRFRSIFPLVVVLCIGLVFWLNVAQLRRLLEPLQVLREGTRRIGDGDFEVQIGVQSGDEFEDLALSFNAMSGRLRSQFENLQRLVDLDRSILSERSSEAIVSVLLARGREIHPCDVMAVVLADPEHPRRLHTHLSASVDGRPTRIEVELDVEDALDRLVAGRDHFSVVLCAGSPAILQPLRQAGASTCLVLPLTGAQRVDGLIVLGHADSSDTCSDRIVYARQVATQVAVALQSARTLEANRVLAYYDNLTGIPNRLLFRERLSQALIRSQRSFGLVAVCQLDLDDFKRINDTLGHEVGDQLLRSVATRLSRVVREGSFARMGGDEFAILLTDFERADVPARVMQSVLARLEEPFEIAAQSVVVTASIGIAVYPSDGESPDRLLRNADSAMYHAKSRGRNNYQFYTESMNAAAIDRLMLEGELRTALRSGELRLYYQPIVELESREIVGLEALVRWLSPSRGLVLPGEFIPLAEETGLVAALGDWVLDTACRDLVRLHAEGFTDLDVAVNLSGRQFQDPHLLRKVSGIVTASGLSPEHLTLELTESVLMDSVGDTLRTLEAFRSLGIRLSIDDFGTGYSSLSYLKSFPLDKLKIDRSFVRDLGRGSGDSAISRAVIAMAHSLSLRVVAEGVEREEQLSFLRELGCDCGQGFLFAIPMPIDELSKLLRDSQRA